MSSGKQKSETVKQIEKLLLTFLCTHALFHSSLFSDRLTSFIGSALISRKKKEKQRHELAAIALITSWCFKVRISDISFREPPFFFHTFLYMSITNAWSLEGSNTDLLTSYQVQPRLLTIHRPGRWDAVQQLQPILRFPRDLPPHWEQQMTGEIRELQQTKGMRLHVYFRSLRNSCTISCNPLQHATKGCIKRNKLNKRIIYIYIIKHNKYNIYIPYSFHGTS